MGAQEPLWRRLLRVAVALAPCLITPLIRHRSSDQHLTSCHRRGTAGDGQHLCEAVVLEGAMTIDEAMVTGEPIPVEKTQDAKVK